MVSDDSRYEAVRSRDTRFDGAFFFAVTTTGIYCRPSCSATTPKQRNVRFFPTAAAAQTSGFRACRRCRPDAVPGSAAWHARADVVGRAMRLIGDGVIDREGVAGLAARLGYSARQVQRQLRAEVGAGPIAVARAQRAHTARTLLQTTSMPATEVAFAAGFTSVRQFNDTVRQIYAATPGELRAAGARRPPRPRPAGPPDTTADRSADGAAGAAAVRVRLAYRGPYATSGTFDYLAARAVAGVEEITGEPGTRTYRRTLRLPHGTGVAEVAEEPGDRWLQCRLLLSDPRDLTTATQRVRNLFDLDADPWAVSERLSADAELAPLVARHPGLRAPGTVDPHELAFRAVLGQQVSVAAGQRLADALVARHGRPLGAVSGGLTHLFPTADALAEAALTEVAMPESRRATLRTVAGALATGTVVLDPGVDRDATDQALRRLRGVGPWTAGYVRMRALGDPDVLLTGDVAVAAGMRKAGVTARHADGWRPWRSYATHLLWNAAAGRRDTTPP